MFRGNPPHLGYAQCAFALLLTLGLGLGTDAMALESRPPPLRVVVLPNAPSSLQTSQAARMITDFASSEGRKVEWSIATHPAELFARLTTNRSDLVVGSLPAELASSPSLVATSVVATERYVAVGRRYNPATSPLDLRDTRVAMSRNAPLWDYFKALKEIVPGLQFEIPRSTLTRKASLQLVSEGVADVAVVALGSDPDWLQTHPDLRVLFDLTGDEPVNWYLRREDNPLCERLNAFIERFHTAYLEPTAAPRDFATILRSGVLRVITRVEQPNYYIANGKPSGFEFEMARAFADLHGLRLEVLVARDEDQMRDWLREGMGDLITARMIGGKAEDDSLFSASRQYHYTAYAAVSRVALPTAQSLAGHQIVTVQGSPEWRAARSVDESQPNPNLVGVDAAVPSETVLEQVAAGLLDSTLIAGDDAIRVLSRYPQLKVGASIPHQYHHRWLTRRNDPLLLDASNRFLDAAQSNGLETMLSARYFDNPVPGRRARGQDDRLSPFDPLLQRYAERYGFDWRLIAAQMYQESQFDPAAMSRSGAVGLMQLLPSTAEAIGLGNVARPEIAIHAGIKYLYTLRNEFDEQVPVGERTWFALAAYNLGAQRVAKAREMASQLGLDPNRWSGNVEKAMTKLARNAANGGDSRYGQALIYVRSIQLLYGSYRNLLAFSGLIPKRVGAPSA